MWDCQQLIGLTVAAIDGEVGRLTDLCFDEERWEIKYFIVDTSSSERQMTVTLGVDQLAQELLTTGSAGVPFPFDSPWMDVPSTGDVVPESPLRYEAGPGYATAALDNWGVSADVSAGLRRVEEVRGYRVLASDGDVGVLEGFLISESSWAIEYVVVETPSAFGSRRVVLVPSWIQGIDNEECTVRLGVPRDVLLAGPEFTADVQQGYETWLRHTAAARAITCH